MLEPTTTAFSIRKFERGNHPDQPLKTRAPDGMPATAASEASMSYLLVFMAVIALVSFTFVCIFSKYMSFLIEIDFDVFTS